MLLRDVPRRRVGIGDLIEQGRQGLHRHPRLAHHGVRFLVKLGHLLHNTVKSRRGLRRFNAGWALLVDVDAQADAVHLELQEGRDDRGALVQHCLQQLQKRLRLLFFAHCRSVLLATDHASVIVEEWTNQSSPLA